LFEIGLGQALRVGLFPISTSYSVATNRARYEPIDPQLLNSWV